MNHALVSVGGLWVSVLSLNSNKNPTSDTNLWYRLLEPAEILFQLEDFWS